MNDSPLTGLTANKIGVYELTVTGPCKVYVSNINLSIEVTTAGLTTFPIYVPIPQCLIYVSQPEAYEGMVWLGNLLQEKAELPYLDTIEALYVDARHKEIKATASSLQLNEVQGNLLSISSVTTSKLKVKNLVFLVTGYHIISLPDGTKEVSWESNIPQFCSLAFYHGTIPSTSKPKS